MLSVEERVDDGQMWMSTAMQRDFIHHLPSGFAHYHERGPIGG